MDETPASLPSAAAPASDFAALRKQAQRADDLARAELNGTHPALWRIPPPNLALLEAAVRRRPATSLKLGKVSTVLAVELESGTHAILKHYLSTKRLDPRDRLGRSKAMRSLFAAEALQRRGVKVARPLGAWSRPGQGSFLLLEDLQQHLPLHQAIVQVEGKDRAILLATLADLLRRMHRVGVAYRDLKPSNILVSLPATTLGDFRFVDHDRNRFLQQEVPLALALRDLAALHAGLPITVRASERMQALAVYCPAIYQRNTWVAFAPAIVHEAALRKHRWQPHFLLGGATLNDAARDSKHKA